MIYIIIQCYQVNIKKVIKFINYDKFGQTIIDSTIIFSINYLFLIILYSQHFITGIIIIEFIKIRIRLMTLKIFILTFCSITAIYSQTDDDGLLTNDYRWAYGVLSGTGLSLIGFVAAALLVWIGTGIKSDSFKSLVRVLYALACGSMIGDAIIHIISEAYKSDVTDPYIVSLILVLSILLFIVLDRLFQSCGISHSHSIGEQHQHDQENINKTPQKSKIANLCEVNVLKIQKSQNKISESKHDLTSNQVISTKQQLGWFQNLKGKGSSGYLNLLGSLIHNWMDGIAIGLAFATGDKTVYGPMIIAVFAHQIPRQLGDVAILLEAKFSNRQTIMCNGIINLISLVGTIIGLATSGLPDIAQQYIMVFVAGNFLYIAADVWKHILKGKWYMNILELLGFFIGLGAMFGIKALE